MNRRAAHIPPISASITASLPATLLLLAGCSNMSGLGGTSEMTCAAPPGVPCQSVSGVYANAIVGNLPSQKPAGAHATEPGSSTGVASMPALAKPTMAVDDAAGSLGAIRSDPTVIRIWIAPWEDADGDLHGDSYVYLQVDSGRWLIEHNRERIRRAFAPVPAQASAPVPAPKPSGVAAGPAAAPARAAALRPPLGGQAASRPASLSPRDTKEVAP